MPNRPAGDAFSQQEGFEKTRKIVSDLDLHSHIGSDIRPPERRVVQFDPLC